MSNSASSEIKGEQALEHLCGLFGVTGGDKYEKALAVADMVLADLYKPAHEKMELVKKMAYAPRYANWEKLGILPGGANAEIVKGVVKCSTNLNSDPVDMLLNCLKLGISTGLYGLTLTNLLNDVMLGEPELRPAPVGLGVIDPDYINIMITGNWTSALLLLLPSGQARDAGGRGQGEGRGREGLPPRRMHLRRSGFAAARRALHRGLRRTRRQQLHLRGGAFYWRD